MLVRLDPEYVKKWKRRDKWDSTLILAIPVLVPIALIIITVVNHLIRGAHTVPY